MSTTRPSVGPVDFIALTFQGNHFTGQILPAIQDLVDAGTIRIIDVLFAVRQGDEEVRVLEIAEVENELFQRFDPVVAEITGLITPDDVRALSAGMAPDSSLALLLFENTWARKVGDAIEAADGQVIMFERIPRPVVQDLMEEHDRLTAGSAGA
jgi:Family of unknown function (DUF6325)